MPQTILITGFGPFPSARLNPTEALVRRLARLRRPALADMRLIAHVFATSYRAVDRDLRRLIAQHGPDAILMFGLAARRRVLTVETRARNAASTLFADAAGQFIPRRFIARGPVSRPFAPWVRVLVPTIRAARVPARLSHDAGRYVCNYLCWQALEATARHRVPLAAFVHVPQVQRRGRPLALVRYRRLTDRDLVRAGETLVAAVAREVRRNRTPQFRRKR